MLWCSYTSTSEPKKEPLVIPIDRAHYRAGMSPNAPKTPARQIRIGDEWYDFERAAGTAGTERSTLVRAFIAWYLCEPGAELPSRPFRADWMQAADAPGGE
jgi:hypothetical protein